MQIFEDIEAWTQNFQEGWLSKLQRTGTFYWDSYILPKNKETVSGAGVDLSKSRLMLISSAGGYIPDSQEPFNASSPFGDYSVRKFSTLTSFEEIAYAHEHYDQTAVKTDPQVLLPLKYLGEMVTEEKIGSLASVVNFMGYQPDVSQVLDETIPAILEIAKDEKVDAALLVPS
ncbi:MAG: hypothetical protein HN855_10155 [Anaerolineae bacterium]|jgi:D-proline reductase (dithiol) PrdB|nr:hypothetical protein [Anaerolineae bacterium]MBT7071413.1 hypothetical protein [Anaerolineae bacterium]MBT7325513.1 hypothetical protein [Anaerolineae bacterium]